MYCDGGSPVLRPEQPGETRGGEIDGGREGRHVRLPKLFVQRLDDPQHPAIHARYIIKIATAAACRAVIRA